MLPEFTRSDRELPNPGEAGADDGLVRGPHGRYREEPAHQEQGQVGLHGNERQGYIHLEKERKSI